ncbi:MAG: LacI family DNA-binding transcriptional regulator [Anaerolineae bacterium]|nr:LacI family DNA-binding transcriptional regulator [Anaerolineae bacterium]
MARDKNITIADIAHRVGVSVTTASRVINNSEHPVSAETRARVLRTVEELGFTPSAVARALATQRTRIIGVIVGDSDDPYFSAIVRGIQDEGRKQGYLVIVCNSDRIPGVELTYARSLLNQQVDGLIFAGGGLTDSDYVKEMRTLCERIVKRGGAVVALSEHLFPIVQVTIDNRRAAQDLASYLIELGHRRIALIAGPEGLHTTALRTEGYRLALQEYGIAFDSRMIVTGGFRYRGGMNAVEQLWSIAPLPTAILASNDEMAFGAMVALKQRGVHIPDDVSLVGFDDLLACQFVDPPLTTMRVPLNDLGSNGMRRLLGRLNGETFDHVLWLPHEIVERKSAAPPRGTPSSSL